VDRVDKARRRERRARLLRGLTSVSGALPGGVLDAALRAGSELARFSKYERVALDNLERALGAETTPQERARIARGVRRHSARLFREWMRLAREGSDWVDDAVELDASVERLDALAAEGRGLLICTAHVGNWELLCAALRRRGLDGAVVGRHRRDDPSSDWLIDMRRNYGVTTLAQDEPPRRMLEVLRAGGTLGILTDLAVKRLDNVTLPFLGVPALTMTAPAALARAARLPLLPVRCIARGERYAMSVEAPLALDPELERRAGARDLLQRMNAVFEGWIRETPDQWAWHQPRWRTGQGSSSSGWSRT
jgi:KDO2-lipid IV(A) lauroyltransferase